MNKIRLIKNDKDQNQFINLTKYCFVDETGWSERIFPLDSTDKLFGYFIGHNLVSGTISKYFNAQLFGQIIPLEGISCVVSGPGYRNSGYVKQLLLHILKTDYERGMLFSALYPFSFLFYQKVGFGSLGPSFSSIFSPKEIRFTAPPSGRFMSFNKSEQQLNEMFLVYNKWVQHFDFGILFDKPSLKKFNEELEFERDNIFLYYNKENNCEGMVRFHFKTLKKYVIRLKIVKIAWANAEAFKALLYFLWAHRDQCQDIKWTTPASIPVSWITQQPRINQKVNYRWMGRPLHVKKILEIKIKHIPINGKFTFSICDEILPENTATYTIEGDKVIQQSYNKKNTIPFTLFSSLLFGGISLTEAIHTGLISIDTSSEAEKFFSVNRNIYLTEFF